MRVPFLILAFVPVTASSAQTTLPWRDGGTTEPRKKCAPTPGLIDYQDGTATVRRLGEMPPAAHVLTVYRAVDGCPTPVVLRRGIGADNGAERPPISGDAQMRTLP